MMQTRPRPDPIIVHVVTLAILTTATNASALGAFGAGWTTMPLAIATLLTASLEWTVRRRSARRPKTTEATRDLATLHLWSCVLAAVVSVTCATTWALWA